VDIVNNMPLYSWQNIQRRIKDINFPIGAEIGVHRGVLSNQLLKNIPHLTLYMIDIWSPEAYKGKGTDAASEKAIADYQNNWEDNFKEACKVRGLYYSRAHIIKMASLQAVSLFQDNYFDFVFLDACHDEMSVWIDTMNWWNKIKKDGWMSFHDYNNPIYLGVKKAADNIFGYKVVPDSDFTAFVRKI
jgi:hypothetical protein